MLHTKSAVLCSRKTDRERQINVRANMPPAQPTQPAMQNSTHLSRRPAVDGDNIEPGGAP